jgi:DNA-directed RNA polymerase omega subunit
MKLSENEKNPGNGWTDGRGDEKGVGIDSNFRLIVVAALRSKQLLHGSRPRIQVDPFKRRNTSIALEEVRRGLVPFKLTNPVIKSGGDGAP